MDDTTTKMKGSMHKLIYSHPFYFHPANACFAFIHGGRFSGLIAFVLFMLATFGILMLLTNSKSK